MNKTIALTLAVAVAFGCSALSWGCGQEPESTQVDKLAGQAQGAAQALDPHFDVNLTGYTDGMSSVSFQTQFENGEISEFKIAETFSDGRQATVTPITLANILNSKQPLYATTKPLKVNVISTSAMPGFNSKTGGTIKVEYLNDMGLTGAKYDDFYLSLAKNSAGYWHFCLGDATTACTEVTSFTIDGFRTKLHGGIDQITPYGPEGALPAIIK